MNHKKEELFFLHAPPYTRNDYYFLWVILYEKKKQQRLKIQLQQIAIVYNIKIIILYKT